MEQRRGNKYRMTWWRGNNEIRVAEIQEIARIKNAKGSRSRWDLLTVRLEDPKDKHSAIVITREGHKDVQKFTSATKAKNYVCKFYSDLIYNSECHY